MVEGTVCKVSEPWIKMRTNLLTNPKVVRISVALKLHRAAVCGACFALWSLGDQHSVNGKLPGYTYGVIDEWVGVPGFCGAAERVEWVKQDHDGVTLPNFGRHNGETAKKRAQAARRASRQRARTVTQPDARPSRQRHAPSVTKCAPRSDEIRGDKTTSTATGRAAAAAAAEVLADEEIEARKAYLRKRPDWLPDGKPWIDASVVAELASMPRLDQATVESVYRVARDGRLTMKNPAGLIVKRLRAAGGAK